MTMFQRFIGLLEEQNSVQAMKIMKMTIDKLFIGISSQAMKLDVEYKEDKISSLGREVADLENRGADQEEVDIKEKTYPNIPNHFVR